MTNIDFLATNNPFVALAQWFPTGGTRTPRGTQAHCRGYVETFNNHLCYVILFENHQHGGTHGMTNRLRGYTRQKRLGNTALAQWFPTGGTRTPRGTQAHCRGYVETFNNHLCYVILFENHQHGGTHGMTNRLRGYTRQKRLGNTALADMFWVIVLLHDEVPSNKVAGIWFYMST